MINLTKPQISVLRTVQRDAGKHIQYNEGQFLTLDGYPLRKRVVNNLIKKGVIAPSKDGLLDGFTQTYEVVSC
jgi:hypothetical protein